MANESHCAHNYTYLSQLKGTTRPPTLFSLVLKFFRLQQPLKYSEAFLFLLFQHFAIAEYEKKHKLLRGGNAPKRSLRLWLFPCAILGVKWCKNTTPLFCTALLLEVKVFTLIASDLKFTMNAYDFFYMCSRSFTLLYLYRFERPRGQ